VSILPVQAKGLLGLATEKDWLKWPCEKYDSLHKFML